MRVISMVPSWTETLIACGIEVVGRTRFCIHPSSQVKTLPVVGGTKDIQWEKAQALKPDLLILDQEENPKSMADQCPFPFLVSHVTQISDVSRDLNKMAQTLKSTKLEEMSSRWQRIDGISSGKFSFKTMPGILEWVNPLKGSEKTALYLIWNKPWMAVAKETFIGSVLEKILGLEKVAHFSSKYPEVNLEDFDTQETVLLFSTEPFPFHKKKNLIAPLPFGSALIDGEAYSWFGLRTLQFLERHLL